MDVDSLPIDIHSSKLLDWLVSRRHCSIDWQKDAYKIREKINHAIQDMPEHEEIVKLLSGTYINYFHVLKITDILKETEADTKNMFGFYSSQRMKDWQQICKMYEKDGIYLAEAAQILQRLVQYEVPAMKKQITKCNTNREESEKKERDYLKQGKESERMYEQECQKMGIKGEKIRSELINLAANLPDFFADLTSKTRNLKNVADYYSKFRMYVTGNEVEEENLLPLLNYVLNKGNTTFYEWKYGKTPDRIDELKLETNEEQEGDEQAIDFGDEIDLDFGDSGNVEIEEIDFGDIETVDQSGDQIGDGDLSIHSLQPPNDGIAHGDDAFCVLENSKTQKLFLQDLLELEAFLKSRILDLMREHPADFMLASQRSRDFAGSDVTAVDQSEVEKYLANVQVIKNELCDTYKRHLYKIRGSPTYLTKLTEEIEQKKSAPTKCMRMMELMKERQIEMDQEVTNLAPKLDLLVKRTKELQREVESEISKKYKNRPVNIMGGITAV